MAAKSTLIGATLLAVSMLGAAASQANTVTVLASGSIWLAGQPSGVTVSGYFGSDSSPEQSPTALAVTDASLTFAATGYYSVDADQVGACYNTTPAGGCYGDESGFSPSPWSNDYSGPDALVGIFLDSTPTIGGDGSDPGDGYAGPLEYVGGPDYTNSANTGPGTYSPALDQIFYIGTGAGETFNAPAGATELYLAVEDSIGGSNNNLGAVTVTVTGAEGVPEPASWTMMLVGIGALGGALRQSRRKSGAAALAA